MIKSKITSVIASALILAGSLSITAFADETKLPAPGNITCSAESYSVKLSWDEVKGAEAYKVWRYDEAEKRYVLAKFVAGTSTEVTGLDPATEYKFIVTSYDKVGSEYVKQTDSKAVKATTKSGSAKLAAPKNITLTATDSSVKLSWDKVDGAAAYRVWRYDDANKKYVAAKFVTGTSCEIKSLSASKEYKFIVTSYIKSGDDYIKQTDSKAVTVKTEAKTSSTVSNKTARNVFYSPHTGNDSTGNGTKEKPFKTEKKAKEYASTLKLGKNEEAVYLEFMMAIEIYTQQGFGVSSSMGSINMIPFTGKTDGYYFKGEVQGTGYDTQKWGVKGYPAFSARYLLTGKDYKGQACSIFIENTGDALDKCTPFIITDSSALADWQTAKLRTIVDVTGYGVLVQVYKIH